MLSEVKNAVVRDNIEGNRLIEAPAEVRSVLGSRELQRLRHIRQMGLSSLVFPTAEHSRFAHSLGVYATARQVFSQLKLRAAPLQFSGTWFRFDDNAELDFSLAALCHDIGHTAFSHVLEQVLLPESFRSHEECTRALIAGDTKVAAAIDNIADREAVLHYFDKVHPNKALNDLISSPFDVDRCDYVLRDGLMSGVEYGKYDLKWLVHALRVVKSNYLQNPVLLLDGPRGIDALRQFLSARRYLHRHVYYHASVRAAQLLLKGIFARMQDIGPDPRAEALTPLPLTPILKGHKPTLGQFLDTTDVEVNFMIRGYARSHPDETLKYLANLYVKRKFPKCILDSAKRNTKIEFAYEIEFEADEPKAQLSLPYDADDHSISTVVAQLQEFAADRMSAINAPADAARYLVARDRVRFSSDPPADLLFAFQDEVVSLENIQQASIGFDINKLLDAFAIERLFVPPGLERDAHEFLSDRYERKHSTVPFS